jgi:hypothetical protein
MLAYRERYFTMKKLLYLSPAVCLCLFFSTASVRAVTFVTASGATNGGRPVSAQADFTFGTGANANQISITLTNLLANPTDVSQLISDLFFTLSNNATTTGSTGSGTGVNIASNGTASSAGSLTTVWTTTNTSANTIHLDDLGAGASGPANLIIGPAGPGGVYTNANGSIAGNSAHNPFLANSANFVVSFSAPLPTGTTVTGATFSFGTTAGQNVPGQPLTPVPEPATMTLLAGTAAGLFFLRRKLGMA